jgi:DNA-directed RNA polymerase subunit RPC12/RpoP
MRFSCKNCKFKFEKEVKPNACPYCGGNRIEREKSAEEFLDDIQDD